MDEWEPMVVRGYHIIQLLNEVSEDTLLQIRKDLGDETFANCGLVKIVEKTISNRRKKQNLENLETVSVEEPDFWDNSYD